MTATSSSPLAGMACAREVCGAREIDVEMDAALLAQVQLQHAGGPIGASLVHAPGLLRAEDADHAFGDLFLCRHLARLCFFRVVPGAQKNYRPLPAQCGRFDFAAHPLGNPLRIRFEILVQDLLLPEVPLYDLGIIRVPCRRSRSPSESALNIRASHLPFSAIPMPAMTDS